MARYIRTPEDLDAVVTIGTTPESRALDFKRTIHNWDLPRGTDNRDNLKAEAQQETCRDIAQFANTEGGCLLIGVAERLDPATRLKLADAIHAVADPDAMTQWIEEAIRNYLVPATFSREIVPVLDPRGTVLAVNVPASIHLITLWDSERRTIECLRRTSHGKDWMNPDELERHIMNGSRATKLAFDHALQETPTRQVRVAGGYWTRVGNPPNTELRPWYPDAPVNIVQVGEQWFELQFHGDGRPNRSLILPFGVVEHAWVGADERVNVILSVRVVLVNLGYELTLEPYA
jgi:hypothetical protein